MSVLIVCVFFIVDVDIDKSLPALFSVFVNRFGLLGTKTVRSGQTRYDLSCGFPLTANSRIHTVCIKTIIVPYYLSLSYLARLCSYP